MKKITPANCLTAFRLLGAVALPFLPVLSVPFYIIYTLCGLSDAFDGMVARMTKTAGDFGARLDSAADLLFYSVVIVRLIPVIWEENVLPLWGWYWALGIVLFRMGVYCFAFLKFHRFPSLHTMLNKATSLLLFASAYLLRTPLAVGYFAVLCTVATVAGIEELVIHLCNRKYGGECISLWWLLRTKYREAKED